MTAPTTVARAALEPLDQADPSAGLVRLFDALATSPARASLGDRADVRYRAFLGALAVAVYTTDAEGRITYFNEAAVELWGRRPELGEEWCGSWRLFHLDGRSMAHGECPMAIALKENRPVRGSAAIALRPDGRKVAFEPYPTPLRAPDGTLVGAVNVLVDVTERLAAEEALRASAAALEASNAVKDEFLGLVSHELRTPVTTIYGNAIVLRDHRDPTDAQRDIVGDISEDSERLLLVVENLLQLTRLGSGAAVDAEPQVLDHLVERAVETFRRRHPARPVLLARSTPTSVVDAEATSIELVIDNLLGNADKYSAAGIPIEVEITTEPGAARVEVLDRGIGINAGDADELFKAFYRAETARRTASGIGVGLAVCKRVVEAQGGRIWARSRDGGGAAIGFRLPVSEEHEESLAGT
jgi:PAS domain S-box-containing protein